MGQGGPYFGWQRRAGVPHQDGAGADAGLVECASQRTASEEEIRSSDGRHLLRRCPLGGHQARRVAVAGGPHADADTPDLELVVEQGLNCPFEVQGAVGQPYARDQRHLCSERNVDTSVERPAVLSLMYLRAANELARRWARDRLVRAERSEAEPPSLVYTLGSRSDLLVTSRYSIPGTGWQTWSTCCGCR
jgi:hypothetical protein